MGTFHNFNYNIFISIFKFSKIFTKSKNHNFVDDLDLIIDKYKNILSNLEEKVILPKN